MREQEKVKSDSEALGSYGEVTFSRNPELTVLEAVDLWEVY